MNRLDNVDSWLADNGLAFVMTDVQKNTNVFLMWDDQVELPRGMVSIAQCEFRGRKVLTALISDVREAAARVSV